MKISKVIQTRKWFLDIASNLNKLNFVNASVEFREACFIFKKKVNTLIEEKRKEIFTLPTNVCAELDKYNAKIFECGQEYAILNSSGKVAIENNTYNIDPAKSTDWLKKKSEIDKEFSDSLSAAEKNKNEENEWLNKKVSINIKKLEHISSVPALADNQEAYTRENKIINKNIAYDVIINALCEELVNMEDDDGKEVE